MERITLATDAIFATIQGEGKLTGVPSIFIRLAGCNLFCTWNSKSDKPIECDTAYAAYKVQDTSSHTIEEIFNRIIELKGNIKHIVITGGEPLLQATPLITLCKLLKNEGFHITIETNGTVFNEELFQQIDLYSISPKLASSAPADNKTAEKHNSKRINIDTLTNLINYSKQKGKEIQLKFVVTCNNDILEIQDIISRLPKVNPTDILIMVAGSDNDTLNKTTEKVLEKIIANGWRYCDRLHIRLFGNTPGK